MSLRFNTTIQKNNHQKKQNQQNIFLKNQSSNNYKINNDNNMNPNTLIIRKSKTYKLIKNEDNKINNIKLEKENVKEKFTEQTSKLKNLSKNAKVVMSERNSIKNAKKIELTPKTSIIHRTKKKLENIPVALRNSLNSNDKNNYKKNNFNNDFNINFIKDENNVINRYLKNKSALKNSNIKNNFLKESINLNLCNLDDEPSANEIEENKVNKLLENSNSKNKKELYKISEEDINNDFNQKFNTNKKNNSFEEKDTEKNKRHDLYNSANNNLINTDLVYNRSLKRRSTFQSQNIFEKEKMRFPFDKKGSLNICSSKQLVAFKNSIRDLTKPNINKSINNIIIPLINRRKENNCFLNVIIQNLTHLQKFKDELLLEDNEYIYKKSKPIFDLYDIIKLYENEQKKYKKYLNNNKINKEDKNKLEPIISVNNFRFSLNQIYNRYHKGESGDPMETMNSIFDLMHEAYCKTKKIDKKEIKNCKCLAHKHFFLKLVDIQLCPNCNSKKVQLYDKDCFMYNVYINEIINKLHSKSFNSFKLKLFQKLKEHSETFEERKKIPGCNCNEKLMESYIKRTKIMGPINTYLIINITWSEEFPSLYEILKTYVMIPMSEEINNLFTFDEALKSLTNYTFSIKGIILYGLYHYVCAIYIKAEKRWAIIDDKTIKYINNYFNLIDSFLRNHLMPVGIIYSKEENDALSESIINSMSLNKDEYTKLYQFCKDIDNKRGLKTSEIFQSKINFDEEKGDYINNNLFYNIFDKNNDKLKTQELINNIQIKNNDDELNNNNNNKEIKNIENDNSNIEHEKEKNKIIRPNIFSFSNKLKNNLEGDTIFFSGDNNKKIENKKDDKTDNINEIDDCLDIGKNYED